MKVRVLVPAYFDPTGNGLKDWERLLNAAPSITVSAIANPNDGPGAASDQDYRNMIRRAKEVGIEITGYVSTNYGKRPKAEVKKDIDRWVDYYPEIDGIFFDEQSSGEGQVILYRELFDHARSNIKNAVVIGNPGVVPSELYSSQAGADIECIFESDKGFDDFSPPPWVANYPPERFCALLLHVSGVDRMKKSVRKAVEQGMGNVYVTDDKMPNPWDRLPSYWTEEVEVLKKLA
jgi:hypothetical protein